MRRFTFGILAVVAGLSLSGCHSDDEVTQSSSTRPELFTGSGPEVDVTVRPAIRYATAFHPTEPAVQVTKPAPAPQETPQPAPKPHHHHHHHVQEPVAPPVDVTPPIDDNPPSDVTISDDGGSGSDDMPAPDGAPRHRRRSSPPWQGQLNKALDKSKLEKGWRHKEKGDQPGDGSGSGDGSGNSGGSGGDQGGGGGNPDPGSGGGTDG